MKVESVGESRPFLLFLVSSRRAFFDPKLCGSGPVKDYMNPDIESIIEQFTTEEEIEVISDLKVLSAEEDLGIYSLQFKADEETYRIKAIKENVISWNIIRQR